MKPSSHLLSLSALFLTTVIVVGLLTNFNIPTVEAQPNAGYYGQPQWKLDEEARLAKLSGWTRAKLEALPDRPAVVIRTTITEPAARNPITIVSVKYVIEGDVIHGIDGNRNSHFVVSAPFVVLSDPP